MRGGELSSLSQILRVELVNPEERLCSRRRHLPVVFEIEVGG